MTRALPLLVAIMLLAVPSAAADRLVTIDVTTGARTTLRVAGPAAWHFDPCWARDGSIVVASVSRDRPYRYVAYGARPRTVDAMPARSVAATLAPGCGRVLEFVYRFGRRDTGGFQVRDFGGRPLFRVSSVDVPETLSSAWSPDASRLALARLGVWGETLTVLEATTGRVLRRRRVRNPDLGAQAFSPDGRSLLYTASGPHDDLQPTILDVDTGARRVIGGYEAALARTGAWSPAGDRIAFTVDAFEQRGGESLHVVDLAGDGRRTVPLGDRVPEELLWSPDGRTLAVAYERGSGRRSRSGIAVLPVDPPGPLRPLVERRASVAAPAWSPDSLRLATVLGP
jgi:dipeptidyl aminopeptidase/acylaminoacyl peptidase